MASRNLLDAQTEIAELLRTAMPELQKNILCYFDDNDIKKNANFSPAIFVIYLGFNASRADGKTAGNYQHAIITQQFGVYTIVKDARGAAYTASLAGQTSIDIIAALQGQMLTGYATQLTVNTTPRPYSIDDATTSYPLIFSADLIISGTR
jgi:hypothetical protein